jgi:hypothetical protein
MQLETQNNKKKSTNCKTGGQEDLIETCEWKLEMKPANLDFSTTPPNFISFQVGLELLTKSLLEL